MSLRQTRDILPAPKGEAFASNSPYVDQAYAFAGEREIVGAEIQCWRKGGRVYMSHLDAMQRWLTPSWTTR